MAVIFLFLFGIANFALHKAVLESGHPLLGRLPWFFHMLGGRFSLSVEFLMLFSALLLVAQGSQGWAWTYAAYSVVNAVSAWLILTDRV